MGLNKDNSPKVTTTRSECLDILKTLERPTVPMLHKHLTEVLGRTVSLATLHKWCREGDWVKMMRDLVYAKRHDAVTPWDLKRIKLDARGFDNDAYIGLKSRTVEKLAEQISKLELKKAADYPIMADFLDRLSKLGHDQSGTDISKTDDKPTGPALVTELGSFLKRKT